MKFKSDHKMKKDRIKIWEQSIENDTNYVKFQPTILNFDSTEIWMITFMNDKETAKLKKIKNLKNKK